MLMVKGDVPEALESVTGEVPVVAVPAAEVAAVAPPVAVVPKVIEELPTQVELAISICQA